MPTPKNVVEDVEEPSTSTRQTVSSAFLEDPPEEMITFVVGPCGCWRVIVIVTFCFSMIACGLHIFSMPLLHPKNVEFNCTQNKAEQNKINPCYTSSGNFCTNFSFSADHGYTMTEKYKLICDNGLRIAAINAIFKFGMISGYILYGIISDNQGRKNLFIISLLSQLAVGILISANTNYWFYALFRFLHGMCLAGMALISTILTCEISSNKCRTFNIGLLCISISLGQVFLPYIWIKVFKDPKSLSILYCLHFFILFFVCCVRESTTYLLYKHETPVAEKVLALVARLNRVKTSNFRIRPVQITRTVKASVKLCDVLKESTRNMVLALFLIWFLMFLMHSANENSNFIEIKDPIERTKIMGGVSLCAAILSILMCYIFKHKITITLLSILTCSISIASYAISKQNIKDESMAVKLQLSSYGFSKLLIFTVFNMTPRLFPTELRGLGTAVATAIGIFSYTIADLIFVYYLQYLSLVVMSVIVSICTFLILIATKYLYKIHNRELPDLFEDSLKFNKTYKPVRWTTIRPISATLDEVAVKVIDFETGTSESVPFRKENTLKKNTQNKSTQN